MNDQVSLPDWAPEKPSQSASRHLGPAVCCYPVPHGGHIEASFTLRKGSSHVYGCHPEHPGTLESYFSTQDDAMLHLSLKNCSPFNLQHVRVSEISLTTKDGAPPNGGQLLPDGNAFIEIIPDSAFFGKLERGEESRKKFSIVTRGTAPGRYFICMKLDYSIDDCSKEIKLPLTVRAD